jgi:hypothetical protein
MVVRIAVSMFGPSIPALSSLAGAHGLGRLNRLHRLDRLHRVARIAPALAMHRVSRSAWTRRAVRTRREPSMAWLLVAGLAVVVFVKVMSVAGSRRRSTVERILLAGLLLVLGAIVLSFRRSAARYRS